MEEYCQSFHWPVVYAAERFGLWRVAIDGQALWKSLYVELSVFVQSISIVVHLSPGTDIARKMFFVGAVSRRHCLRSISIACFVPSVLFV